MVLAITTRTCNHWVMAAPIALYVRVSRKGDREDERFHSPREQEERARALVASKGLVPGPVFEDIDVSGGVDPAERPGMGRLLNGIDSGEFGGVAAFSLDRLSRDPSHGDALVRRVTKAGGIILTPDIPEAEALDSPTGEFTFSMLLVVARLYRSQSRARFAVAKERAIVQGIPVGPTPIGYRQGADRRLEIDPETGPLVRELFERRAAGEGRNRLSRLVWERTGRHWSREGIAAVLRNRLYVSGRMTYGDVVSEWAAGGIIDEALFQAAQRQGPDYRPPRGEGVEWLLSGLLKCENCGFNLSPSATNSGRKDKVKRRYYKCVNRRCDARSSVRAERLEPWVVLTSFRQGDVLEARREGSDLSHLEEALAVAERRYSQVLAPEARDALGDDWAADVKARRSERDEAAAALGGARAEEGGPLVDLRLRDIWDDLPFEDRKAALRLYWKAIHVGKRVPGEGTPLRFVARGPGYEAEVALPVDEE